MKKSFALALLIVSMVALATPQNASAQFCSGFGVGPYSGFGYGGLGSGYGYTRVSSPPYFAVYPPVYYGQRVRMTYGHSPFASLPYTNRHLSRRAVAAPKVVRVGKIQKNAFAKMDASDADRGIVKNPYFRPTEELITDNQPTTDDKVTLNPYFRPPHKTSRTRFASLQVDEIR